jgi:adenosine deaminase
MPPSDALGLMDFLRAIPKVEIHCHLFGTVRQGTFVALAEKTKAPLSRAQIDAFYARGYPPASILPALRALDEHLVEHPDDLYRITHEYLEDAAAEGVRYTEVFWNPTGTARRSGIAYPRAHDAILRAMRDAQTDLGIIGRLIPSIDREAPPQEALEMVEWVIAHRAPETIGIGIDYNEVDRPPELFVEAYCAARAAGLKATAHAGEFGTPWTNVRTAIELLGVDRIDHGYTVLDNPEFAQRCAELGIVFTVVPTNTYYLRTLPRERWALDHPIRRMPARGIRVHPNTDDPTLHKVKPSGAWHMMMKDFGFGLDDLRGFMLNGLDGAWIDDRTRAQWRREWTREFDNLRRRIQ